MKKERVKLLNFKAAHNAGSFGLELNVDRSDCQISTEVQTADGLFLITDRQWVAQTGILYLTMRRVPSNRKNRRQKKIRQRLLNKVK